MVSQKFVKFLSLGLCVMLAAAELTDAELDHNVTMQFVVRMLNFLCFPGTSCIPLVLGFCDTLESETLSPREPWTRTELVQVCGYLMRRVCSFQRS